MIDPTLLARIKKCFALSASSNEHEAAAALAKARDLMDQHGLTEADIAMLDVGEKAAKASRREKPARWEALLSAVVCRALNVVMIVDERRDFAFVGRGPTPEIASYAFTSLHRRLKKARAEYMKTQLRRCSLARKRARGDAFCDGWVMAVYRKVMAIAPDAPEDAAISRYVALRFGDTRQLATRSAAGKRTDTDYWRGHDEGREVNLHRGMDGAAPLHRLGVA